jgi:hypothetical protein
MGKEVIEDKWFLPTDHHLDLLNEDCNMDFPG